MPRDRVIDPNTGDYVSDGGGGFEYTATARTAIYYQMTTVLNGWWGDYTAGNNIHELLREGDTAGVVAELRDRILLALKPLLDAGRVANPRIEIAQDDVGKKVLVSSVDDMSRGGERIYGPPIVFGA